MGYDSLPFPYLALLDVTVLGFLELDDDLEDSRAASIRSFSICPVWRLIGREKLGVCVPDPPPLAAAECSTLASFNCWKYNSTHESENRFIKKILIL